MSGSGKKGKRYPHTWMSGADETDHKLYMDCLKAKAQAKYRGQEWEIQPLEYIALWRFEDRYLRKGRAADSITMTRQDKTLPWSLDNVKFQERKQHLSELYSGVTKKTYKSERGDK